MRRLLLAALAAVVLTMLLLAPSSDATAEPDADQWRGELPIRQPWLRDHLPDDALAYLRIPHPLGLLSTPKGNVLDPALRSESNVEMLRRIQQGIVDNVLPHIPAFADLRLRLAEQYLRSPVEVAAAMSPAPAVTISMNIAIDSNVEFENVISLFGGENPQFGLAAPLDSAGVGQLLGAGSPVFLQFDAQSGRLILHGGPAVTAESFAATLAAANRGTPHPMTAMEARIDDSGQGFFMWLDAAQAMPMMQLIAPPEQVEMLAELGLDKIRSAAYGWGVANGKGRLAIIAELPADADRGALPYIAVDLSARSVGNPDGVIVFAIPDADEFGRIVDVFLAAAEPDAREEWLETRMQFRKSLGVSIDDVLNAVGPEFVGIFDEAGDYSAVRIRDRALWDSIIARMSEKLGRSPDERRISGDVYYHVALPNEIARMGTSEQDEAPWFFELVGRMRDHVYWTADRDYLYLASVPQVLIDRAAMRPRTDIGDWLANTQRIEAGNAVLSISGTSQKLPRRLYMAYIEIMQVLADVAEADADIWSMPTARQLRLPAEGAVGFTINLGNPLLSAEFTFENNPFELLGGLGGVATVGVLAAIAIPAYQDYTIRAQVAEGLSLSAGTKAGVVEHYLEFGQFPGLEAAGRLSIATDAGEYVVSVVVEPGSGVIYVQYRDNVAGGGGQIVLEPVIESGGLIRWSCSGSFADKHMPAACRN